MTASLPSPATTTRARLSRCWVCRLIVGEMPAEERFGVRQNEVGAVSGDVYTILKAYTTFVCFRCEAEVAPSDEPCPRALDGGPHEGVETTE